MITSFTNSWRMKKCEMCLFHWSYSYHPFCRVPLTLNIMLYATHLVRPKFTQPFDDGFEFYYQCSRSQKYVLGLCYFKCKGF